METTVKVGRPRVENRLEETIGIKVTGKEKEVIAAAAERRRLSMSAMIRMIVLTTITETKKELWT